MKVNYDEATDTMYIKFSELPYYESDEVSEGIVLDYDKKGKVIAIEILDASKNLHSPKYAFYNMNFEIFSPNIKKNLKIGKK